MVDELKKQPGNILRNRTNTNDNNKPESDSDRNMLDIKEDDDNKKTSDGYCGLGSDFFGVCVLMVLYVLQGVPLGLSSSIPILIQNRVKGYSQQAAFSIVSYPFSSKLLWAPLVDCFYSRALGRRKSWLVPLQLLIGSTMLYIPNVVGEALGNHGGEVNVSVLAGWFCFLTFLAATQDIAVDGWALTILSKRNIGWGSTCNTVGQTVGYFFGYLGFLALESPMFCNMFRSEEKDYGCITMEQYLVFWGCVFIVTTTLVAVFVREKEVEVEEEDDGCVQTYLSMMKIIRLKNVLAYAGCIFVLKMSFSPLDALSGLKLMEAGLSKDLLVTLSAFLIPLQVLLPLVVTKYTNSQFPLNTYVNGVLPRMLGMLTCTLLVYWAFATHTFSTTFYLIGLIIQILYSVAATMMFVSQMMFHAKVSDVKMGGTYMTLLNTLVNLSGTAPQTLSLWMVDRVTMSSCHDLPANSTTVPSCYLDKETCATAGGSCVNDVDGFFIMITLGAIVALIWRWKLAKIFLRLQNRPIETWHVSADA